MNWITACLFIIFLKTLLLHYSSVAGGKLTISSRMTLAVCEQRDEYSISKKIVPPLKKPPPTSTDLACGWFQFRTEKCPYCPVKFKTCAQVQVAAGSGNGNAKRKGARTAGKFRSAGSKIDPSLLASLQKRDGSPDPATTTIIISMQGGNDGALKSGRSLTFATREDKINSVVQSLHALAKKSQTPVINVIEKTKARSSSVSYTTLWITNQIVVENADLEQVQELAKLPEVSRISPDFFIPYSGDESRSDAENENENGTVSGDDGHDGEKEDLKHEGWNMKELEVAAIWEENIKGSGVVIGSIGLGARGSHKGLKDNFRSDHGWFDVGGSAAPVDEIGYGTQTLGAMVTPLNNLGVAPGAQWIACKPFLKLEASYKDIVKCSEWMLCPTDPQGQNPDCTKAPNIVLSAFNVNSAQEDFARVVYAWHRAGIFPVFGTRNVKNSTACSNVTTPADNDNVFTVGALEIDDNGVATTKFSSGKEAESGSGNLVPEVVAPGNWIQTLGHNSDDEISVVSGSDPAAAQVAGIVALLLSVKKDLSYSNLYQILTQSAKGLPEPLNAGGNCSEDNSGESKYPNNFAGYGKVNAVTAFKYLREKFNIAQSTTTTTSTSTTTTTTTTTPEPIDPTTTSTAPAPIFRCYVGGCGTKKLEEPLIPECVIQWVAGFPEFVAQRNAAGRCGWKATKCKFCHTNECNHPFNVCLG